MNDADASRAMYNEIANKAGPLLIEVRPIQDERRVLAIEYVSYINEDGISVYPPTGYSLYTPFDAPPSMLYHWSTDRAYYVDSDVIREVCAFQDYIINTLASGGA